MTLDSPLTLTLDRRLLEHPQAFHLRRMRTTLWLYLTLLGLRRDGSDQVATSVALLSRTLGLKEGTISSWLGHLRSMGYVQVHRRGAELVVRFPAAADGSHHVDRAEGPFSVAQVARALGAEEDAALAAAIQRHSTSSIQRALAGALVPPASEIRRSRTALFLFLLKHYDTPSHDHPRD